jgi:outer membrane receptor protein involved in Fe transport
VLSAQTIINSCYDAPDLNNSFCTVVFREPGGLFSDPATIAGPINFQTQKTAGVDVDVAWNRTFGNGDRLGIRGIFSYVIQRTNYIDPANPDLPNRQLSELGDPQIEFQIAANYRTGPLRLRYQIQYIGKQNISTFEAQHRYDGNPPTNADVFPVVNYPSIFYHNARIGWEIDKKFEFYFGVDNITNRLPPFGSLGVGAGSSIFDNVGRYFYSGFKANF